MLSILTTRILQPADVAVFRPIKYGWRKAVLNWRITHPTDALLKENFAPTLKLVVDEVKPSTLVNGFNTCDLYPWNSNSLDCTKCLGKNQATLPTRNGNRVVTPDKFEEIIGGEMVQKFHDIETVIAETCEPPLFFTLCRVWEEFTRNKETSAVTHTSKIYVIPKPHCSKIHKEYW